MPEEFERFFGADGREIDSQGTPWREIEERPILRRWKFLRWLFHDRTPEQISPQEPIPKDVKPKFQLPTRRDPPAPPKPFHHPGI